MPIVVNVKFEAVFINVKATIRLERSFSLCAFHQNCLLCSGAGLNYVLIDDSSIFEPSQQSLSHQFYKPKTHIQQ